MNNHQQKQREVIEKIEQQINEGNLRFSTVTPTQDFQHDPRICLTSVHLPSMQLKYQMMNIIEPLKQLSPDQFYYPQESLHLTIKNIKVVSDPPTFTNKDIQIAKDVFSKVIPKHSQFQVYYYRLLLFPNNLALIGTTDEELDAIILELTQSLKKEGIEDDKKYINSKYFFSNVTLARFTKPVSREFKKMVQELSESISWNPYTIDSVTLLSTNAAFFNPNIIGEWKLHK
jgi:2'-5' RNA ligase